MKRRPYLFAAALAALSFLFAGIALAGTHSHKSSSRVGLSDADKVVDQRADAAHWLEYGDWNDEHERYRELRDVAYRAAGGTLDVDGGQNGGVIVTGWGRDSIRVVARIQSQADTKERAQALAKAVRIVNQGGRLSAEGPDTDDEESWSVTFDVLAPRGMALKLEAHNGPVVVAEMNSRMDLETVNGPMVLAGVAGDVRARTENGPLSVRLTGAQWRGARLDASTENGPVSVTLPRGYSCMLETGTINGPMDVNIPIVVQGRINVRHQHVSAKLGNGGAPVRAVTTNGPASVSYAGEGKSAEGDEVEN
jgi:hypothetical protein